MKTATTTTAAGAGSGDAIRVNEVPSDPRRKVQFRIPECVLARAKRAAAAEPPESMNRFVSEAMKSRADETLGATLTVEEWGAVCMALGAQADREASMGCPKISAAFVEIQRKAYRMKQEQEG